LIEGAVDPAGPLFERHRCYRWRRMFGGTQADYEAADAVDTDWDLQFERIEAEAAEERRRRG
jgi:hypothetical protein